MYTRRTEQSKYGNCGIEFDLGFINTYTLILRYPCSDIGGAMHGGPFHAFRSICW